MIYDVRDIRQIKLVTGEEILAEIVGEDDSEFLIRNPLKVHKDKMVVGGLAREINMFTKWMSFADNDEFIIQKYHILVEAIVNDAVANYYNTMMKMPDDEVTVGHMPDDVPTDSEESITVTVNDDGDTPTYH